DRLSIVDAQGNLLSARVGQQLHGIPDLHDSNLYWLRVVPSGNATPDPPQPVHRSLLPAAFIGSYGEFRETITSAGLRWAHNNTLSSRLPGQQTSLGLDSRGIGMLDGTTPISPTAMHALGRTVLRPHPKARIFHLSQGKPQSAPRDVIQSPVLGDCFYLASLGSMAANNPRTAPAMLYQYPNGTIVILFITLDNNPYWVPITTELWADANGVPLYAFYDSKNHGKSCPLWPALFEKAFATTQDWDYMNIDKGNSGMAFHMSLPPYKVADFGSIYQPTRVASLNTYLHPMRFGVDTLHDLLNELLSGRAARKFAQRLGELEQEWKRELSIESIYRPAADFEKFMRKHLLPDEIDRWSAEFDALLAYLSDINDPTKPFPSNIAREHVADHIRYLLDSGDAIVVGIRNAGINGENDTKYPGLIGNHAYSLIDIEYSKGGQGTLLLRNPWGGNPNILPILDGITYGPDGTLRVDIKHLNKIFHLTSHGTGTHFALGPPDPTQSLGWNMTRTAPTTTPERHESLQSPDTEHPQPPDTTASAHSEQPPEPQTQPDTGRVGNDGVRRFDTNTAADDFLEQLRHPVPGQSTNTGDDQSHTDTPNADPPTGDMALPDDHMTDLGPAPTGATNPPAPINVSGFYTPTEPQLAFLREAGLQYLPTPADGKCLYHAVSLSSPTRRNVPDLCDITATYLTQHADRFRSFGTWPDPEAYRRQVERLRDPDDTAYMTELSDLALFALAWAGPFRLTVIDEHGNPVGEAGTDGRVGYGPPHAEPITILRVDIAGGHYLGTAPAMDHLGGDFASRFDEQTETFDLEEFTTFSGVHYPPDTRIDVEAAGHAMHVVFTDKTVRIDRDGHHEPSEMSIDEFWDALNDDQNLHEQENASVRVRQPALTGSLADRIWTTDNLLSALNQRTLGTDTTITLYDGSTAVLRHDGNFNISQVINRQDDQDQDGDEDGQEAAATVIVERSVFDRHLDDIAEAALKVTLPTPAHWHQISAGPDSGLHTLAYALGAGDPGRFKRDLAVHLFDNRDYYARFITDDTLDAALEDPRNAANPEFPAILRVRRMSALQKVIENLTGQSANTGYRLLGAPHLQFDLIAAATYRKQNLIVLDPDQPRTEFSHQPGQPYLFLQRTRNDRYQLGETGGSLFSAALPSTLPEDDHPLVARFIGEFPDLNARPYSLEELHDELPPGTSFQDLIALREYSFRRHGMAPPTLSRQDLDESLQYLWHHRDRFRRRWQVDALFQGYKSIEAAQQPQAYLNGLVQILANRAPGPAQEARVQVAADGSQWRPLTPENAHDWNPDDVLFVSYRRVNTAGQGADSPHSAYKIYISVLADPRPQVAAALVHQIIDDHHQFPGVHSVKVAGPTIQRADNTVIYVADLDAKTRVTAKLRELQAAYPGTFAWDVPSWTEQELPGVSFVAEVPRAAISFGHLTTKLVFDALARHRDHKFDDFHTEVVRQFHHHGFDPLRVHLKLPYGPAPSETTRTTNPLSLTPRPNPGQEPSTLRLRAGGQAHSPTVDGHAPLRQKHIDGIRPTAPGAEWESLPGDGNCMYHLLARILDMDDEDAPRDLRKQLTDARDNSEDDYAAFRHAHTRTHPEDTEPEIRAAFRAQNTQLLDDGEFDNDAAERVLPHAAREFGINLDIYQRGGITHLRYDTTNTVHDAYLHITPTGAHYHYATRTHTINHPIDDPNKLHAYGPPRNSVRLSTLAPHAPPEQATTPLTRGLPRPEDITPGPHGMTRLQQALEFMAHVHPFWLNSLFKTEYTTDGKAFTGMWWRDEDTDQWELIRADPQSATSNNVTWPAVAEHTYRRKFGDPPGEIALVLRRMLPDELAERSLSELLLARLPNKGRGDGYLEFTDPEPTGPLAYDTDLGWLFEHEPDLGGTTTPRTTLAREHRRTRGAAPAAGPVKPRYAAAPPHQYLPLKQVEMIADTHNTVIITRSRKTVVIGPTDTIIAARRPANGKTRFRLKSAPRFSHEVNDQLVNDDRFTWAERADGSWEGTPHRDAQDQPLTRALIDASTGHVRELEHGDLLVLAPTPKGPRITNRGWKAVLPAEALRALGLTGSPTAMRTHHGPLFTAGKPEAADARVGTRHTYRNLIDNLGRLADKDPHGITSAFHD
ncbi:MAG: hypothetical protein J2P17_03260, partial [Mycobacterium sp.]|nr:hypothetical protein [Mycobacterium sp.]